MVQSTGLFLTWVYCGPPPHHPQPLFDGCLVGGPCFPHKLFQDQVSLTGWLRWLFLNGTFQIYQLYTVVHSNICLWFILASHYSEGISTLSIVVSDREILLVLCSLHARLNTSSSFLRDLTSLLLHCLSHSQILRSFLLLPLPLGYHCTTISSFWTWRGAFHWIYYLLDYLG